MRARWSKSHVEKLRWEPVLYKDASVGSLIRITLTKLFPKKILRQHYLFGICNRAICMNSRFIFISLH
jgi:hypothetical protein